LATGASSTRHCERSEAIPGSGVTAGDCFGVLRTPRNDAVYFLAFTVGLISRISRPCSNATICSKHSEK